MLAAAFDRGVRVTDVARAWVRLDEPVEPIAGNVDRYRELFGIYRELYPLHREHFRRLKALRG